MKKQMTVHLVNAAVMPAANGVYRSEKITRLEFTQRVQMAHERGILKDYIGYPSTCQILRQETGITFKPNRSETQIVSGDELLCIKLIRRQEHKGEVHIASIEDYEFRVVYFNQIEVEVRPRTL